MNHIEYEIWKSGNKGNVPIKIIEYSNFSLLKKYIGNSYIIFILFATKNDSRGYIGISGYENGISFCHYICRRLH